MNIEEVKGRWEAVEKRETWARDVMRKYADRDIPFLISEYDRLTAKVEQLEAACNEWETFAAEEQRDGIAMMIDRDQCKARVEALERAIKYPKLGHWGSQNTPCGRCANYNPELGYDKDTCGSACGTERRNWVFDEARFAGGSGNESG